MLWQLIPATARPYELRSATEVMLGSEVAAWLRKTSKRSRQYRNALLSDYGL